MYTTYIYLLGTMKVVSGLDMHRKFYYFLALDINALAISQDFKNKI